MIQKENQDKFTTWTVSPQLKSYGKPVEFVGGKIIFDLMEEVKLVGPTDARVLVTGETGTGKSLIARAMHYVHPERGPNIFRPVNVGALVPDLASSQLFGHVKGAFTGADHENHGIALEANKGTMYVDEIDSCTRAVQTLLLTIIETSVIRPVGGGSRDYHDVDIRFITSSIKDSHALSKIIRTDLYHRIAEYHIALPPLRERGDDISQLAFYFLQKASAQFRKKMTALTKIDQDAIQRMNQHPWYGNVRELNHAINAAVIRSRVDRSTNELKNKWIILIETASNECIEADEHIGVLFNANRKLNEAALEFKKNWVDRVVKISNNRTEASETLGIDPKTLKNILNSDLGDR
ncbi:MAG: sigma-54-dependent Fis family transcriptional regulator [Candidatus Thorarchaeota archaeon]|nr:sigma-54-dependent Fis family transcriptional regulator [Candidatus Thorarchaeota archaeon]